jgi:uncharacterized membrane protein
MLYNFAHSRITGLGWEYAYLKGIVMNTIVSADRIRVFFNRLRERLWVKPLAVCLLSIVTVFAAKLADGTRLVQFVPAVSGDSVETLLSIMASSMLVIATFSVASMVSAYASASSTATPRTFTLVVADDASQNALSTFVGAFIFSIVALTAVKNDYFGTAGLFILFVLTATVFGIVIITFVRWVDRIARLGRMGSTISKVETATTAALKRRRVMPTLGGVPARSQTHGQAVFADSVGYVQHVDMVALQAWACAHQVPVRVAALPGTFVTPGRALAYITILAHEIPQTDCKGLVAGFKIARDRLFDDDPRFGLVVLSEIAGRALSPAVNDPGTAIDVVGTLVRLFSLWSEEGKAGEAKAPLYDRVEVPEISVRDMFDDAFTSIARDGAGIVEVSVRLQKALCSLTATGNAEMRKAAEYHAGLALKRAQLALEIPEDFAAVQAAAANPVSSASSVT